MEETPNFRMQCPKCGKAFPFDATHCEECSAMLEPVETTQDAAAEAPDKKSAPLNRPSEDDASAVSAENMEDIKIGNLKADIENKFLFTVLLELDQLKARITKKEKALAELHDRQSGMDYADFVMKTGKAETEVEDLMKKTAKLELILESLEKTIVKDIAWFEERISGLKKPSFLGQFDHKGRYYRMLASELKVKKILLDIIGGRVSRSYFRRRRFVRFSLLIVFSVIASMVLSWSVITYTQKTQGGSGSRTAAPDTSRQAMITENDIRALLEDIKTANLHKDLKIWESRYSREYLELEGKRETIQQQWGQFDYMSLTYAIEDLQVRNDSADAAIVWDIEFRSRKTGGVTKVHQRLLSRFILEDGKLKITSVKKADR